MLLRTLPILLFVLALSACKPPGDEPQEAAKAQPGVQAMPEAPTQTDATKAARVEIPTLQIQTLDGDHYDLAAHRGKWVVVNFWATWCGPCLKEMPELSALDAMRQHVEVIGLAYEEISPQAMGRFLDKHPVVYPIAIVDVYDPPADFETPRGLPMTYLIAPDGTVAERFLGPVTARDVETVIAAADGPKPGQAPGAAPAPVTDDARDKPAPATPPAATEPTGAA